MTVGVVGGEDLAATVEAAGAEAVAGEADAVLADDPDWVVAAGEAALLALVRAGVSRPVLPIAAGRGVRSVPRAESGAAIEAAVAGEAEPFERPLSSVAVDGERAGHALFDVTLVTAEPARISEFSIRSGGERVARFRADGVVAATPAGSGGYAGSAGGPVLAPGTGVLAVVPIAPFVTNADHWVLDAADVALVVEREEPVALVVDDREVGEVPQGESVQLSEGGRLSLLSTAGSQPFYQE